jgi:transcriptional regulator with XRE-family HTH domain
MFWDTFVELCNKQNKKPNPVAKELGISSGAVTRWKNGSVPQSTIVHKIADYFGVSVDYLLGEEKATTPTEPKLSEGEEMLLDLFRRVPEDKQELVLQMIRVALGSQE